MSAIINGDSPSVTFSDGTTQATSAIVSGKVPYTNLPAGVVLQVVYGSTGTQFTTTSATPADIGLTAAITPKFTTSKILIFISLNGVFVNAVGSAFAYGILIKNSTNLGQFGYIIGYTDAAINRAGSASFSYLDSPATTSSITYKVQGAVANGGTVNYQRDNQAISSITLMEIAG